MPDIVKHLRTKQVAVIGTSIVLAIAAVTFWNWSSKSTADLPSNHDERSVKHKKSIKKDVSDGVNNQDQNQSQIEKQDDKSSIAVKEEKVVVVKEEKVEIKKTEPIETHFDEASSTKSHCLSAATSSADESDICTPKHESNTNATAAAKIQVEQMADTQEKEQVKFDWTDDSVTEALPTMNRDIVTSVESVELVEPVAIKDDFVVVDYPVTTESSAVTESATTETVTDPVAEPVIEPVVKAITEPATEAVAEPVAETIVEPVVEPVVEPIVEKETPKRPLSSSLTASAPEFIPKSLQQPQPQQKRSTRKFLTREQLIEQQRQHHMPRSKARCSHWPHCTNNNCKFFHPYRTCRAGDDCLFGDRCMFVHPNDCTVNVRDNNHHNNQSNSNSTSNSNSNTGSLSITAE